MATRRKKNASYSLYQNIKDMGDSQLLNLKFVVWSIKIFNLPELIQLFTAFALTLSFLVIQHHISSCFMLHDTRCKFTIQDSEISALSIP